MNSNDMPTPVGDIIATAADATNAVSILVTEYKRAVELIHIKNRDLEDHTRAVLSLQERLTAEKENSRVFETKLNLLLTSNGLLDFDITSDTVPAIPGVNCNEEPAEETTARRPARLKGPVSSEPNDANTDTSSHQAGNLFGSNE